MITYLLKIFIGIIGKLHQVAAQFIQDNIPVAQAHELSIYAHYGGIGIVYIPVHLVCGQFSAWLNVEYFLQDAKPAIIPAASITVLQCQFHNSNDFISPCENLLLHSGTMDRARYRYPARTGFALH